MYQTELMKKNYFHISTLIFFLLAMSLIAQETCTIEGLSLYPNPVSDGKVYITTKNDSDKEIIIFDVLGKKVLQTTLSSKELNVSNLPSGVYIIQINENDASATRKLIIR